VAKKAKEKAELPEGGGKEKSKLTGLAVFPLSSVTLPLLSN